jgi:hypothetical protein
MTLFLGKCKGIWSKLLKNPQKYTFSLFFTFLKYKGIWSKLPKNTQKNLKNTFFAFSTFLKYKEIWSKLPKKPQKTHFFHTFLRIPKNLNFSLYRYTGRKNTLKMTKNGQKTHFFHFFSLFTLFTSPKNIRGFGRIRPKTLKKYTQK